jgi:hypothetical protein
MGVELLKNEYETPRAQVRGVFLLEGIAVPISATLGTIKQEQWGTAEVPVGDSNSDGDIWISI